jgi:hypothetical protein
MQLKFAVDEEVRKYCFELAKQQRGAGLNVGGTSKFQTNDPIKDHAIGLIGEYYFNELMSGCIVLDKDTKIQYRWENNLNGQGDPFDFIINRLKKIDGKVDIASQILDVKTGYLKEKDTLDGALKHFKHYINAKQLTKRVDMYVYNLLSNDMKDIYFIGWITRKDVINTESFKPRLEGKMISKAAAVPINRLNSIDSLFPQLELKMSEELRKRFMGGQMTVDDAWGC